MKPIALVVAAAFIFSACTGESGSPPLLSPPALMLTSDDGEQVELHAFTYCWTSPDVSLCADGDPWYFGTESLAGDATFSMEWPLEGWSWTVEARNQADQCDAVLPRLTNQEAGTQISAPSGGELVFLSGRGPEGDATFAFNPAFRRPLSAFGVSATVALAPPDASPVDATGLSLRVSNVQHQPERFTASALVQGAGGRIAEFELVPATAGDCWSGTLHAAVDSDAPGVRLTGFQLPLSISLDLLIGDIALRSGRIAWPDDFTANSAQSPDLELNELVR